MEIRTVTVDFWGTLLFDPTPGGDRHKRRRLADFHAILATAGVRVAPAALDRAYEESGLYLGRIWAEHRDVPVDEHVRAMLDGVDPALAGKLEDAVRAALLEAYARPALFDPPTVDATALDALRTLGARGYTLAVVSNSMRTPGRTLRTLLDRHGLLGCFAHTTFSDEVGVRKPAAEIFRLTLRAVGGDPARAVHVGDDTVLDVRGARAAGMRVVQVAAAGRSGGGDEEPDAVIGRLAELPAAIEGLGAP